MQQQAGKVATDKIVDGDLATALSCLGALLVKEEAALEQAKENIAALKSAMSVLSQGQERQKPAPPMRDTTRGGRRRSPRTDSLAHNVRVITAEILKEEGRPLTRHEIYNALSKRGFQLNVKQPLKRLTKILWAAHEFENIGVGYWFSTDEAHQRAEGE